MQFVFQHSFYLLPYHKIHRGQNSQDGGWSVKSGKTHISQSNVDQNTEEIEGAENWSALIVSECKIVFDIVKLFWSLGKLRTHIKKTI